MHTIAPRPCRMLFRIGAIDIVKNISTVENKYAAIPRYIHLVADFLSKYSFNMSVQRNIEINKTVPRAIGSGKKGKSTTLRT
jgi:hypothetical protein